jgi:GNAT superfamily N-acetyltransferase
MGWWVGPNDEAADLGSLLSEQGWTHAATLTGMAIDLLALREPTASPPGLTISPVDSADALTAWCQIMTSVSEFPDFAAAAWQEMYRDIGVMDHPQWRLFLGRIDGVPVSTSALFLSSGVAGIHGVTTLAGHRGRGIGTAMTCSPLLEARSQGFRVGVLLSSDMAVGVYDKIGFQEYCRGEIYLWEPAGWSPPPV